MSTTKLPLKLYNAAQVRELDRMAIEIHGVEGFELMQRAARFAFHCLMRCWPNTQQLILLCGSGNNAGDGYVMAALAAARKIDCHVLYLSDPEQLRGDAQLAYARAQRSQVSCAPFNLDTWHQLNAGRRTVIVDALLGTGLQSTVREPYAAAIQACNAARKHGAKVFAVDLPSGLSADTGQPLGCAIEADATASFIGMKLGLLTGAGPHYAGRLFFDALDVPEAVFQAVPGTLTRLDLDELLHALPPRRSDSHKGQHGHVVLLGGNLGLGGALIMAAEAALRCGAGLVSVGTRAEHRSPLLARQPELMVHAVNDRTALQGLLDKANAIIVGPGLGQDSWSQLLLSEALQRPVPTVLDADALNLLVQHPDWLPEQRDHLVYTPHPGEAARMLECDTATLQADRLEALRALQRRWGGSIVLKGAGTLLSHPDHAAMLCPYGNAGMACGGMGDVLSGVLGGLLVQGFNARYAVNLGVCLHSAAADALAARHGPRGLLASDLTPEIRSLLNGVGKATPA